MLTDLPLHASRENLGRQLKGFSGATPPGTGRIVGCQRGWGAARWRRGRTACGAAPPVAGPARPEPGTARSPARRVLRHGEPLGDRADPDVRAGLAWTLQQGPHVLAIPGTGNPDHLAANVAAATLRLSPGEMGRLKAIS